MKNNSKISLEDFVAYLPMHTYIFLPTREPWPAASVDSQFPPVALLDDNGKAVLDKKGKPKIIDASLWLDINRPVHQMTWAPGLQMLIRDKVVADGGWVDKPDAICLNLYRPPTRNGKRGKVRLWLDHVRKIYPDDHDHIIMWLAHRVQRPQDKINHALMLGGAQGIGKDTLLEPVEVCRRAVELRRSLADPDDGTVQRLLEKRNAADLGSPRPWRKQSLRCLRPHQDLYCSTARHVARR